MTEITYRNRRAARIGNEALQVTVLAEGGHIAEIQHKSTSVNPLWTPPWPSIEPSAYDEAKHPEYGQNIESRLLAGIMGHNICMDIFGVPSPAEEAAGLDVHGEAATAQYDLSEERGSLRCRAALPEAGLVFSRLIGLSVNGGVVRIAETVENLCAADRPIGWTQHATMGPPFLKKGRTQLRASGTRSKVFEGDFAGDRGLQEPGAEFDWPGVPLRDGSTGDLQLFTSAPHSGGFTTTLMDPEREQAFFAAWDPESKVLFGYVWNRTDFPWLGRWEENLCREQPPWNGQTIALGMEFGVSPMPETRRQMIERGPLFGAPTVRWIPAKSKVTVEYCAFVTTADAIPDTVVWDGRDTVSW